MPVTHLPAETTPDVVADVVKDVGAVVVDRLASQQLMDRITQELQPYLGETSTGSDEFNGVLTRRTGALISRSSSTRELVMHPTALATTATVLADATNFQLHLTQAIAIEPGQPGQALHRDEWAFDFFPFPDGFDVQCNTIWALTDFTEENGATRVVVGSNHADRNAYFKQEDTEPAAMERGSVLFYSGSVFHGGGANQSTDTRIGLNITYARGWLRQEENQYLAVPREIAETLPIELLRLMGYDRGAYALGYVGDLQDPLEVLVPGAGSTGFSPTPTRR